MKLYNEDCLKAMKDLSDNSIDIVIADLPYGRFKNLDWDKPIDLKKMWIELNRICKKTTPIFLFADMRFGVELINSNPKNFKYEIVWNKMRTTTPLLSRKRLGKAAEYIFIFYHKQPVYNYAKYHKIIDKRKGYINKSDSIYGHMDNGSKKKFGKQNDYAPKLPTNVITQPSFFFEKNKKGSLNNHLIRSKKVYEPRLPTNIINHPNKRLKKVIKNLTEKPQFILEFLLKYFSNENDTCLDFCMGSGSTGVACKTLQRRFIGMELKKEHYDAAAHRLNK